MATIAFNCRGSTSGGGPSTFVYKTVKEIQLRGHRVVYSDPHKADAAICIIDAGKFIKKCAGYDTKLLLRIDGIYSEYYKKFQDKIRPDMNALRRNLLTDIPSVNHMVYQSNWSKDRIDEEIITRDGPFSIIHNSVDTNIFKPIEVNRDDDCINLISVGMIRHQYIMETLIGVYKECRKNGINARIILAGPMDNECANVLENNKKDKNIVYIGRFSNTNLAKIYSMGDIFLGVRQGSSSDNVIAESQSCGVPVVIPSWGGNSDMVLQEKTGQIINSNEWDYGKEYIYGIVEAILKIKKDLHKYKKLSREHAKKNLNIERMVDKYLGALNI